MSLKFSPCLPMITMSSIESNKNTYPEKQGNLFYLCQSLEKVILKLLLLFSYTWVCDKRNDIHLRKLAVLIQILTISKNMIYIS